MTAGKRYADILTRARQARDAAGREGGLVQGRQVVTVWVGDELYALDVHDVAEIVVVGDIAWIPAVPPYIAGVFEHRGLVVAAVELGILLGVEREPSSEQQLAAVLYAETYRFGLLIDDVDDCFFLADTELRASEEQLSHVRGTFDRGGRVVALLDALDVARRIETDAVG